MKQSIIVFLVFILGSCATTYQSMGGAGKLYYRQVSDSTYVIGFRGKKNTDVRVVNDYVVLGAAEVGSKLGFTHFVIDSLLDKSRKEVFNTGSATGLGNTRECRNAVPCCGSRATTKPVMRAYKPGVEIRVIYSKEVPKDRHLGMFVIEEVLSALKSKYKKIL